MPWKTGEYYFQLNASAERLFKTIFMHKYKCLRVVVAHKIYGSRCPTDNISESAFFAFRIFRIVMQYYIIIYSVHFRFATPKPHLRFYLLL